MDPSIYVKEMIRDGILSPDFEELIQRDFDFPTLTLRIVRDGIQGLIPAIMKQLEEATRSSVDLRKALLLPALAFYNLNFGAQGSGLGKANEHAEDMIMQIAYNRHNSCLKALKKLRVEYVKAEPRLVEFISLLASAQADNNKLSAQDVTGSSSHTADVSSVDSALPSKEAPVALEGHFFKIHEKLDQVFSMLKKTQEGSTEKAVVQSLEDMTNSYNGLSARFHEEITKNAILLRLLPAMLEDALDKKMALVGPSLARTITPAIEKSISSVQSGVGEKTINLMDKSVRKTIEATVARQMQTSGKHALQDALKCSFEALVIPTFDASCKAMGEEIDATFLKAMAEHTGTIEATVARQMQASGKQAIQDAFKRNFEASVIPAFEASCKAMFEKIDSTFLKGMAEHTAANQQMFESKHSPLAHTLKESINAASSITQMLSGELADGQQKLIALAAAEANVSRVNPLVAQVNNKPSGHRYVEAQSDLKNELSRLVLELKYEEAFTVALNLNDVEMVSWLCSRVDLRGLFLMVPMPLSQRVVLCLLQQLSNSVNNETSRKLELLFELSVALDHADSFIASHGRTALEQVYQRLHLQSMSPTMSGTDQTIIRVVMHIVRSLSRSCQ